MRWCVYCLADIENTTGGWFAVGSLHAEQPTDKDICPESPVLSLTAPHKPTSEAAHKRSVPQQG